CRVTMSHEGAKTPLPPDDEPCPDPYLFAGHPWQRARQNCIYIEMPSLGNRNGSWPNPFIRPGLISLYSCPGAIFDCLFVFNVSQINYCHVIPFVRRARFSVDGFRLQ